ncbi:hypothetical protein FB451DRAFT_1039570 [Mycena latifolia]|nr:hypothetical protein FB451DRAFT_1039570 [Mycena latifolia]
MPLKLTRRIARQNSDSVLQLAVSLTALSKDLASMSCFPPATALVCVLLLIMETVQTNQGECNRLARRCATILLNINDQMSGRWDHAPKSLVNNLTRFQGTLESIHNFMKQAASAKWMSRFLRKTSIQTALAQYHEELNDASRSFQISTLIEIHYAMNPVARGISMPLPEAYFRASQELGSVPAPRAVPSVDPHAVFSVPEVQSPNALINDADDFIVSAGVLEDQGFRRYHQSEVVLRGPSRVRGGWWSGASEAQVNGQSSLIKRYEGPRTDAKNQWIRDVKALQRLYHPNLPQMLGYSADGVPTPFILLSNVQIRSPESYLIGSLRQRGVASCIENMLRFANIVVRDATFYVQQQMSLSDQEAQDFLESSSLRIDGSNSVILGLPVLNPATVTVRSYLLNETLRTVILHMLPNRGIVGYKQDLDEEPWQLTQLTALVASLLPSGSKPPGLSSQMKKVLGITEESFGPSTPSLRQFRLLGIEASSHGYAWQKNSSIPAHKFSVGDLIYIPPGKDWDASVTLGNIIKEGLVDFDLERKASGVQWCWKDIPIRHVALQNFDLQESIKCWPIAVPPGAQIDCQIIYRTLFTRMEDAWQFLLNNADILGKKWDVPPESIILITQEGTDQTFHINDFGGGLKLRLRNTTPPPRGPPHFFAHQSPLPRVMYLLTSDRVDYEPCWSHSPAVKSPPAPLERDWTYRVGWSVQLVGFPTYKLTIRRKTGSINWAQLHPEDFD